MSKIKFIFCLIYEVIIVYYIYKVSVFIFKIGCKDISRDIFFISLGFFVALPLFSLYRSGRNLQVSRLENQSKLLEGLKKISDYDILDHAILKCDDNKVEIDSLIITDKGIFNIVKCNYKGNIRIIDDFKWNKHTRYEDKPINSPIYSIKKYRDILKSAIDEDAIFDIVLVMQDRVVVSGDENSKVNILRYNELGKFINNINSDKCYSKELLYDKIYPMIYSAKDNKSELSLYNKFLENKWKYRGRISIVLISFVFYLSATLH